MKAWVLGDPGQLSITDKPVPVPKRAEVLVRIDAAAICATDLEVIYQGPPAMIQGGLPFNKNFTPGHEYMGTVVALGPGVDEYKIGQRVAVEIHAGCGQCKRCREGMYTSCHNYGLNYGDVDKGHRANGFTTDGGFCEYQVNNINTLVAIADEMSDEEGALVVTAGTAMYALTELGGLVAGESVVSAAPGPIGLMAVAVAKALGAQPVILTEMRDNRLKIGLELGADAVVNIRKEPDVVAAVKKLNGGKGVDYVVECSAASQRRQRRRAHGQSRRQGLPRRLRARTGAGRRRAYREQQHLPLRHPRRGQERGASRRGFHAAEAFRRHQDSHPHLPARRSADRDPLRQGPRRRRHQGGGEGENGRRPQGGGGVAGLVMPRESGASSTPWSSLFATMVVTGSSAFAGTMTPTEVGGAASALAANGTSATAATTCSGAWIKQHL